MPQARRQVPDGAVRPGLNTDAATIPKNRIVRRHTLTDSIQLCTAATQQPYGTTMGEVLVNVTGDVQIAGQTVVEAGAAVSKGDKVGSDAVGRGVAVTASGAFFIGIADTAASAAGQEIEVSMQQPAAIVVDT